METTELFLRIAVSLCCGLLIGLERQWRQRIAGLRTNTLVSVGACLFVLISVMSDNELSPTRIAAQVVSGIGFIGAGVIIRQGVNISGLNTAATLWCSAAVGSLAGSGHITMAGIGAICILLTNLCLRPVQRWINRSPVDHSEVETNYRLKVVCRREDEIDIRRQLLDAIDLNTLSLRSLHSEDLDEPDKMQVYADVHALGREEQKLEKIVAILCVNPSVSAAQWKIQE